jgi:hypothetical protein
MGWTYVGDITTGLGQLPGAASTPIGYVFDARGTEHITYMALDFSLWELTRSAELWTATNLLAAVRLPALDNPRNPFPRYRDAGPNAYVFPSQGPRHVAYVTNDGYVHELWHDGTAWNHNPLSSSVGGTAAAVARPAAYPFASQNTQHIHYAGASDGHINELWWDSDGWHHRDLTHDVGGTPAAVGDTFQTGGALAGYAVDLYHTHYVDYVGIDCHIHELRWSNGSWGHADLSELSGANADVALPVPPGGISAFFFAPTGTRHVYYYGADQHIHELKASGGGWWHEDLTVATGTVAETAIEVGGLAGYPANRQGTRHVVFTGRGASIIELWWSKGSWAHSDLGSASGAPEIRLVPLSGYARTDDDTQHVFFHGLSSAHINELAWRRTRRLPDLPTPPVGNV